MAKENTKKKVGSSQKLSHKIKSIDVFGEGVGFNIHWRRIARRIADPSNLLWFNLDAHYYHDHFHVCFQKVYSYE